MAITGTGTGAAGAVGVPESPSAILIPPGAVWRYLDDGAVPGTNWTRFEYDDSNWKLGGGPFGYGEGDEQTFLGYGPFPDDRPITTYFRHRFHLEDAQSVARLTARLLCDDGLMIHLNGHELHWENLPYLTTTSNTLALVDIDGAAEGVWVQRGVYTGYLSNENVLAVELHQSSRLSDDASFDLELVSNIPAAPPEIMLVRPVNRSLYGLGILELEAQASDADGHIDLVRFFAGTNQLGDRASPPYALAWQNPPPGRHLVHAAAYDNTGRRTASEPVFVQIGSGVSNRLLRGPYLQNGGATGITVRWRSDWFIPTHFRYGTTFGNLTQEVLRLQELTEHEVRLTDLTPGTKYYYAIGDGQTMLTSSPAYSFVTAPTNVTAFRVWVIGDAGTGNDNARRVRDVYRDFIGPARTGFWLMLGDNAYESGLDHEYQIAVFDVYSELLRQAVVWPTLGNHDDAYGEPREKVPYFSIFSLPRHGESGGVGSGTESYYSFDYANAHFVCLDSQATSRARNGAMLRWLEEDLATTSADWIIAFWHHPPYSFGTHNSDNELELIEMRENAVPVLESYGVDLVLCGHSHNYERSHLLNGHYGRSTTLASGMILEDSGGHPAHGGYRKPAGGMGENRGTVYAVCGCSGEGGYFDVDLHPAMYRAMSGFGSMVIDIDGDELELQFLSDFETVSDRFVMRKGAAPAGVVPSLRIQPAGTELQISWPTGRSAFDLETIFQSELWPAVWEPTPAPGVFGRRHVLTVPKQDSYRLFRLRSR